MKQYDASHPLLLAKAGDPARGPWVTPKMAKKKQGKRPKSRD